MKVKTTFQRIMSIPYPGSKFKPGMNRAWKSQQADFCLHQTTRSYIPTNWTLHSQRSDNPKFTITIYLLNWSICLEICVIRYMFLKNTTKICLIGNKTAFPWKILHSNCIESEHEGFSLGYITKNLLSCASPKSVLCFDPVNERIDSCIRLVVGFDSQ
jgi:hypothetical protein